MPLGFPLPSSDGKKVFVVGRTVRGELVHYDSNSGKLVPLLGGISAEYVDFSKDGQWVAYVLYPEGTLWRRKVDGSERLQLSYPPSQAMLPRWSPDGKTILYYELAGVYCESTRRTSNHLFCEQVTSAELSYPRWVLRC